MSAGASTRVAAQAGPGRPGASGSGLARTVLPPVLLGVAAILLWQGVVTVLAIKPFILPGPFAIGEQFITNLQNVVGGSVVTGRNALIGLVLGAIVGVLLAILSALVGIFDEMAAPIVAAVAVVPIVALAPVLYTMFGANAETARQLVAALAVFVPVYFNTLKGLRMVRPVHRDLMRSYAASSWQATKTVTLPTAVPFVFTGLRIASSLAVISALIAEYFGGPVGGLGKSITSAASSSNYGLAWAYVLGSIILGLLFYCAALGLEKLVSRRAPTA
ncbi:nitrate ABC transporter permease [Cryobacterium sp. LW097]|nr:MULTISPECIES: ABC transporter permease subunit [unclassified Cryobacterium]TFC69487.1 ABC transporter permease subunit [Cryobacterium sp. TMB3-15]ASD23412.1 nitrate ABC transporter permease [Cryobacterium sp. LW097]TFC57068.1 ABC transporter permease subunit [Cryobacterium sp. TMB3-1-2]TFC77505.1 ABC transporter permease subunit [Cryobacterium sp. TMB3-10]TFC89051.1 ABC transporter permease subunit [Cryobacterium sp. TMT4-31]